MGTEKKQIKITEAMKSLLKNPKQEIWVNYLTGYNAPVRLNVQGPVQSLDEAFDCFDTDESGVVYESRDGKSTFPFDGSVNYKFVTALAKKLRASYVQLDPIGCMPSLQIPIFGDIHYGFHSDGLVLSADLSIEFVDFCAETEVLDADFDYEKSIENNMSALKALGDCYYFNILYDCDYEKAVELYRKAAALGHFGAMGMLGRCYQIGAGVEQDREKAYEWYKKASYRCDQYEKIALSYYKLSKLAKFDSDFDDAIYWYEKALESGSSEAGKYISELKELWGVDDIEQ